MKKRIISLFMCLVMAFSLLPTTCSCCPSQRTDSKSRSWPTPPGTRSSPATGGENVGGEDAAGGAGSGQ